MQTAKHAVILVYEGSTVYRGRVYQGWGCNGGGGVGGESGG